MTWCNIRFSVFFIGVFALTACHTLKSVDSVSSLHRDGTKVSSLHCDGTKITDAVVQIITRHPTAVPYARPAALPYVIEPLGCNAPQDTTTLVLHTSMIYRQVATDTTINKGTFHRAFSSSDDKVPGSFGKKWLFYVFVLFCVLFIVHNLFKHQ